MVALGEAIKRKLVTGVCVCVCVCLVFVCVCVCVFGVCVCVCVWCVCGCVCMHIHHIHSTSTGRHSLTVHTVSTKGIAVWTTGLPYIQHTVYTSIQYSIHLLCIRICIQYNGRILMPHIVFGSVDRLVHGIV